MTTIATNKLADLTQRLYRKTSDGDLTWELTSIDAVYAARIGEYVIHIFERPGEADQPDVCLNLYNSDGGQIDNFSDVTFSGMEVDGFSGYYSLMTELFSMAARKASGADQAIDEILGLLR